MRVFVALDIPQRTKDNLERSSQQFEQFANGGNFTKKENYHLTLHFLGNVEESNLIYVQSAMDAVRYLPAPQLQINAFTLLPSGIVCAKIRHNANLSALHDKLGDKLEERGFMVEHRAYRPHVTMIRKKSFTLPFSEVTKSVDVFNMPFTCCDLVLYESVFGDSGVTYKPLYTITLKSNEKKVTTETDEQQ